MFHRMFGTCAAVFGMVLLLPTIAFAHVGVLPVTVPAATLQVFTVRVPTERDIPTTSVRIEFPSSLIISRFAPMPGWTRDVEKDGAGRTIAATWSGGSIAADEYQDFMFMGRTPREPGTLVFPAYQTYQDGETVAWTEAPDQEHPAATVEVVAADVPLVATETHMEAMTAEASTPLAETIAETATSQVEGATPTVMGNAVETAAPAFVEAEPTPLVAGATVTESGGSDLALFLALGALVLGVLAIALAVVALMRRPATP